MTFSVLDEWEFKQNVEVALRNVRRILRANKRVCLASEVHHKYSDKFSLAEHIVRACIASQLHCLSRLGLDSELLARLVCWSSDRAVTLQFSWTSQCKLMREQRREVESAHKAVLEELVVQADGQESTRKLEAKTVTTVVEYFWGRNLDYVFEVFTGTGHDSNGERIELHRGSVTREIVTSAEVMPHPECAYGEPCSCEITWLTQHIDVATSGPSFRIARKAAACATPRRNPDIDAAIVFFADFAQFAAEVEQIFNEDGLVVDRGERGSIFSPAWPLLLSDDKTDSNKVTEDAEEEDQDDDERQELEQEEAEFQVVDGPSRAGAVDGLDAGLATALVEPREGQACGQFRQHFGSGDNAVMDRACLVSLLREVARMDDRDLEQIVSDVFQDAAPQRDTVSVQHVLEYFFGGGAVPSSIALSVNDVNQLLAEERRALDECCRTAAIEQTSVGRAKACGAIILLKHGASVAQQAAEGLDFLEVMLRQQLIAAIGKSLTPKDVDEYMRFHHRKLLRAEWLPRRLSYTVRRSDQHTPEGMVSIEAISGGSIAEPLVSFASSRPDGHMMQFPLGATAVVRFRGARHLHAVCMRQFSGQAQADLRLQARARQFCSMIVLLGRIASATHFEPKYAVILQNKDDLTVPLELTTIPAPQEFRDAVESLSPEQREFAKACRAMQLESTLFGILIIQIKPHIEGLLGLPENSLTKELKLTQDLMELFINFQIPADLLAYLGPASRSPEEKVEAVRGAVQAVQKTIKDGIRAEIDEAIMDGKTKLEEVKRETERQLEEEHGRCARELEEAKLEHARRMQELQEERERAERALRHGDRLMEEEACYMMEEARCMMPQCYDRLEACDMVECEAVACSMTAECEAVLAPKATTGCRLGRGKTPEAKGSDSSNSAKPCDDATEESGKVEDVVDYTHLAKELDQRLEVLDETGSVRPTIITPADSWLMRSQALCAASPQSAWLEGESLKCEKDKAFDLLEALSLSGARTLDHTALHIVLAATHCFDKSVLDTVIEDNINPINHAERSELILGSTVHCVSPGVMVRPEELDRLRKALPKLFGDTALPGTDAGNAAGVFRPPARQ